MTTLLSLVSILAILATSNQPAASKQPSPTPTGPATISYIPPKIPSPIPVAPIISVSIHPGGPGDWPTTVNVANTGNAASPAANVLIRVAQTGGALPCAKPFFESDAHVNPIPAKASAIVALGEKPVPKPPGAGAGYTCTWKLTANFDAKLSQSKDGPGNTSASRTFSKTWP